MFENTRCRNARFLREILFVMFPRNNCRLQLTIRSVVCGTRKRELESRKGEKMCIRAYFYGRDKCWQVLARPRKHVELIMTKERRDILDQGASAHIYITMPHYAYEYKCTLGVTTINAAAPPDL